MCGLTIDKINELGSTNINKLLAYVALSSSATEPWPELNIDKVIVVDDMETEVEYLVDYLDDTYKMTRQIMKVPIKHTDGVGMMLPKVSRKNKMIRMAFTKGLCVSFDFIRFCKVNNVPAKLKDIWGLEHDLIEENIEVILFKSQFKMYAFFSSWQEYKDNFKKYGCVANKTNEEEDYIKDSTLCYQFLQTLVDMTDEEIEALTAAPVKRLQSLCTNSETMLEVMGADLESELPYQKALAIYPELLREAYFREMLKQTKLKWTLDGKSGKIRCENKRLFVIPDLYAVCEYLFMGDKDPKGLLADGEVACNRYRNREEVDCLRSPSLYFEHAIRKVVKDPKIYSWLYTDGIYVSCHDLISKVLQLDWDGDMLNVVADPIIINAAKRNIKEMDIVPLNYELNKAPSHYIDRAEMFNGLKRAHEFSGIGVVSNGLTRAWNKENPNTYAAAVITYYNNLVIDAAKTGFVNSYENYPAVMKIVNKATGGKRGKMPAFFKYTKNQRSKDTDESDYAKPNGSTMNRICAQFDQIGNLNMARAKLAPFNWQMLLDGKEDTYNMKAVEIFCDLDSSYVATMIHFNMADSDRATEDKFKFMKDIIVEELSRFGPLENVYSSITKFLFAGQGMDKHGHKQMYWRIFGDIACNILAKNMETYTVCDQCGMKIPSWADYHDCKSKYMTGFFECCDCGAWVPRINSRQVRCEECQEEYRRFVKRKANYLKYIPKLHRQENPYKYKNENKEGA